MRVSTDGGLTWHKTDEVRIWCEDAIDPDGEDTGMSIVINHEGVIFDGLDEDGEVIGTRASTHDEIMDSLQ